MSPPGLSVEVLSRQAGRAAWGVLDGSGWPIPNLPERFRYPPVDSFLAGEFVDPETGKAEEDWAEVEAFDTWWLAFIRWLADQSDVPVTLPKVLGGVLHDFLGNWGYYGGYSLIPTPSDEQLGENWPHIRLASIQTLDYLLTLVPREPEAEPVGDILTVVQAAAMLQVSERTVSRMIQRGHLKAAPIKGRGKQPLYRIRRDAVIECLKERERRAKTSRA